MSVTEQTKPATAFRDSDVGETFAPYRAVSRAAAISLALGVLVALPGVVWQYGTAAAWLHRVMSALLTVRKTEVGLGFAAIMIPFGILGFTYSYSSVAMFTWSSLAVVLYFSWVALVFAAPQLSSMREKFRPSSG